MWHSLCQICLFSTISYAGVGAWHWQHLCLSQSVSVLSNGKINGIERGSMYEWSVYLASACVNLSESICICLARCTLLPQLHPHLDQQCQLFSASHSISLNLLVHLGCQACWLSARLLANAWDFWGEKRIVTQPMKWVKLLPSEKTYNCFWQGHLGRWVCSNKLCWVAMILY